MLHCRDGFEWLLESLFMMFYVWLLYMSVVRGIQDVTMSLCLSFLLPTQPPGELTYASLFGRGSDLVEPHHWLGEVKIFQNLRKQPGFFCCL